MIDNWNAKRYDSLVLPHLRWGAEIVNSLVLNGDETVLDAGAGTGRDTISLLDRLPSGKVIAIDSSSSMVQILRNKTEKYGDRIQIIQSDLTEPFGVVGACDAIISVAAFHWVSDHRVLFSNLRSALKPNGVLAADCGGFGNIERVSKAFAHVTKKNIDPGSIWNFATPESTTQVLRSCGFTDIQVALVDDPAILGSRSEFEEFLGTVILGAHLINYSFEDRKEVVAAVADKLDSFTIDYVRLKIYARATRE